MKALVRLPEWHRIFLATVVVAVFAFMLLPILAIAVGSLEGQFGYHIRLPPAEFSLSGYFNIPGKYLSAFGTSLGIAAAAALISTLLGTMAALAIVRGALRSRTAVEAFFRIPLQMPAVVTGVGFMIFYNRIAEVSGIDLLGTLQGILMAHVFITLPYAVSSVAVVLARMNPHMEEAAQTLGASPLSILRRVTLPVIKPGMFTGAFYAFIVSFGDVPVSVFLAGGSGNRPLPVEIFDSLQFDFEPAVLVVSVLVVIVCTALILAVQRFAGLDLVLPTGRK